MGRPRKSDPSEREVQKEEVQKNTQKKPKATTAQVEVEDDQQVGHLNLRPHGQDLEELGERIGDLDDSWEVQSLFEDVIEDITEASFYDDGKSIFIFNYTLSSLLF